MCVYYSKLARVYLRMCPALAAGIFLEQPEPNKPGVNLPSTIQHKQLLASLSNNTNSTNEQSSTIQHTAGSPSAPPLSFIASLTESSTPPSSTSKAPSSSLSSQPLDTTINGENEAVINNDNATANKNKGDMSCDNFASSTCSDSSMLHDSLPLPPDEASTTIPLTQHQHQTAPKPLRLGVYIYSTIPYTTYSSYILTCVNHLILCYIYTGILSRHLRQGNVAGPLTLGLLAILQSVHITGIEVYILHVEQGYHEGNVLIIKISIILILMLIITSML